MIAMATLSAARPFRERLATELRGFHTPGWLAFALIALGVAIAPPIGALFVLLWAWISKTPWHELGLARPKSWILSIAIGLVAGVALKLAMKAVVMPLLGAPAINIGYQYVAHDTMAALDFAAYCLYGAGFAEELIFRGFLFERFGKLLGASTAATAATLLVTTAIFAVAHWQQGIFGVINAFVTGLVLGLVYLAAGRKLVVPMIMHAAFDLTALVLILKDWEAPVAHLIFPG